MRGTPPALPLPECRRYISRHRLRGAIGYLIMGAVMLLALVKAQHAENLAAPYRPLPNYATGQVLDRAAGIKGPALVVSSGVVATGHQALLHLIPHICNPNGHAIYVRTSLSWMPYDSADRFLDGREFSQYSGIEPQGVHGGPSGVPRPPGCLSFSAAHPFTVTIPVTVVTTQHVARVDHWRLFLADTPIKRDGTLGVRATGYTEPFRLIPTG